MLEYNVSRRKYQLGGSISMMDGYLTVSKEEAKRMIDAAPGNSVTIAIYNTSTMVHKPSSREKKRIGKEIIELAREIGYQNNDFFICNFKSSNYYIFCNNDYIYLVLSQNRSIHLCICLLLTHFLSCNTKRLHYNKFRIYVRNRSNFILHNSLINENSS